MFPRARKIKTGKLPEPVDPIPVPFPTRKVEDWSKKKEVMNRLTPYNLIFVQKAEVDVGGQQKTVFIPRRCMHCDNPACATLCPFAANHKFENGAVVIDPETCFGGAKCQTLCPWQIPQRQSGIGVYLKVLPTLMGNGIMVKCDLCSDLLKEGKPPACIGACPQKAMSIGPRKEIYAQGRSPGDEDRRLPVRQDGKRRNEHAVRFSRPVRSARSRHPQGARGAGTRKGQDGGWPGPTGWGRQFSPHRCSASPPAWPAPSLPCRKEKTA